MDERTAGDPEAPGEPEDQVASTADSSADSSIEGLLRAGRHAEAAERARALGEHLRAADIYERIWEFGRAATCAREGGDLPRALRNAIDARDEALVIELGRTLDDQGETGQRAAMEVFALRRRFGEAARRAETLGDIDTAVSYYSKAHLELEAARLLEQAGRDPEAGRLLERMVELSARGVEHAQARLHLGRLLYRRMQYEAAARHLQEAAREPGTRAEARHALILTLAAMGLRDAAREVLIAARAETPELSADLESFLRAERESRRALPSAAPERSEVQIIGGRYRLDELLGSGSTGRVFRAHDEVADRTVAVKLFALSRSHQSYERFVREARVAGALRHANLVEIYDFSAEQGYLVMEYLAGGALSRRLRGSASADGPQQGAAPAMSLVAVRRLILDVLAGLELAHQRGIIHRDIKPANIFFDARGAAKLGDFGVAHLLDLGQTQTGGLIGTLAYMAPEQITGAPLTIAADLYSLGISLYEALTGRLPFLGPDFVAQHLGETPPPPSSFAALAPGWDELVGRMLAKNPADRHDSVDELRRHLMSIVLEEKPRPLVLPRVSRPMAEQAANADLRASADLLVSVDALATPASTAAADTAAQDEPAARYQFETALGRTEISLLSRAVDITLNRSVIIERYHEGSMDEATEQRLHALARASNPFLQWALAYDRSSGVAVFEAPAGAPLGEVCAASADRPLALRDAVRLLMRLARAVAPLHERGVTHGALSETTVLLGEQNIPTVLACGLGRASAPGEPDAAPDLAGSGPHRDVEAIIRLVARAAGVVLASAGPPTMALAHALVPALPAAQETALQALADARTGEELYAFAEALELAVLTAQHARSSG